MCATECSAWCHAWLNGRAMWVACNRARFPTTWPRVFCELKIMKIAFLIHQIIQEKFAYGEFFILVMIGYIFMFRMVKKMQNSGLEIVAGLTLPLRHNNLDWNKLIVIVHNAYMWVQFYGWYSCELACFMLSDLTLNTFV